MFLRLTLGGFEGVSRSSLILHAIPSLVQIQVCYHWYLTSNVKEKLTSGQWLWVRLDRDMWLLWKSCSACTLTRYYIRTPLIRPPTCQTKKVVVLTGKGKFLDWFIDVIVCPIFFSVSLWYTPYYSNYFKRKWLFKTTIWYVTDISIVSHDLIH